MTDNQAAIEYIKAHAQLCSCPLPSQGSPSGIAKFIAADLREQSRQLFQSFADEAETADGAMKWLDAIDALDA